MQMNQSSISFGTQPVSLARRNRILPAARSNRRPVGWDSTSGALRRARAEVIRQRTPETLAWAILALSALAVLWLSL